ncbi:translation initiation factor IF-3 [Rapidithrix thailandica]|uniref:Translation initiation factor IF-3 n=1 Tax=Rapidithrix thailandica TaxID=413964 RepID=A0AAW9SDI3_9BACT
MAEIRFRTNQRIRAREVRVVGENVENGIFSIEEALKMARAQKLDLVEISPKAKPPVCKVIDYSKFKYEQKKKQKELKAKQSKTVVKEIRFGPNTDEHDLNFKTNHAIKFLNEGNKVKAYVQFHGRTIVYKDRGRDLLMRFAEKLEEHGKIEQKIKQEGRRMIMMLAPKATKK